MTHSQPTFLHIIIPSWQLTVSVHQIGSLICNKHDKDSAPFMCHAWIPRVHVTFIARDGVGVVGWSVEPSHIHVLLDEEDEISYNLELRVFFVFFSSITTPQVESFFFFFFFCSVHIFLLLDGEGELGPAHITMHAWMVSSKPSFDFFFGICKAH